jgi:RNA polymerase sigma factor (sigma-70 family)
LERLLLGTVCLTRQTFRRIPDKILCNISGILPEQTRWTYIRQAGSEDSTAASAALSELCACYRDPVLTYVRRRLGSDRDAEDLVQDFFARLIRGDLLARANPDRGTFRSFLLHAVSQFISDFRDHQNAAKRGGGHQRFSAETIIETPDRRSITPEEEFERRWARTVLQRALDRLEAEYCSNGRQDLFNVIKDQLDGTTARTGAAMASILGITEAAVRVAVHRMKQRLGQFIREEVAETVPHSAEVDDELNRLRQSL